MLIFCTAVGRLRRTAFLTSSLEDSRRSSLVQMPLRSVPRVAPRLFSFSTTEGTSLPRRPPRSLFISSIRLLCLLSRKRSRRRKSKDFLWSVLVLVPDGTVSCDNILLARREIGLLSLVVALLPGSSNTVLDVVCLLKCVFFTLSRSRVIIVFLLFPEGFSGRVSDFLMILLSASFSGVIDLSPLLIVLVRSCWPCSGFFTALSVEVRLRTSRWMSGLRAKPVRMLCLELAETDDFCASTVLVARRLLVELEISRWPAVVRSTALLLDDLFFISRWTRGLLVRFVRSCGVVVDSPVATEEDVVLLVVPVTTFVVLLVSARLVEVL